jgi:hypothetical protein
MKRQARELAPLASLACGEGKRAVSLAAATFRSLMAQRGYSFEAIAEACGYSTKVLSVLICTGRDFSPIWLKLELAFGYSAGIVSSSRVLKSRRICWQRFHFDPLLATRDFLRRKAKELGIRGFCQMSKSDLANKFFALATVDSFQAARRAADTPAPNTTDEKKGRDEA